MRRRQFISVVAGATTWPLTARAQQASKRPTVALIRAYPSTDAFTAAFTERLCELGWTDGRTVTIQHHRSEGRRERVAEIAAELVQQKVDVIVAYGAAVATLKQATTSIPIVTIAGDPVGSASSQAFRVACLLVREMLQGRCGST
jgi:putative ABC transport system substrate-binding protein